MQDDSLCPMSLSGELIWFPLDVCALREEKGRVNPGTHTYMTPTLWQARDRQGPYPGVHTPAGDNDYIYIYIYIYTHTNNTTIHFFYFSFYIGVWLINNVVTVSGVQYMDSVIRIHGSILPQTPLPSRLPLTLNRLPCAIQQVLVGYPVKIQQCVHGHPKLPNYPFSPFFPPWQP